MSGITLPLIALTDGFSSNLRAKLYKESFEFVRQQRIHCLLEGAWFMNGIPLATTVPRDTLKRPTRPWRFLRLVRTLASLLPMHL